MPPAWAKHRNSTTRQHRVPRVLAVVSAFKPAMLADMHRARMLGWELPRLRWDIEILAPAAAEVRQDAIEQDAAGFFPPNLPMHEFHSMARGLFALAGSHSLAWRTLFPAYRKGASLLGSGRFDLVYISTTTFTYFLLGPLWMRQNRIPYVLDFHDPWVKPGFSDPLQRFMERTAVCSASGLITVSPRYLEALFKRYAIAQPAWMQPGRHATIPFGAREGDMQEALRGSAPAVSGPPDTISLVYVGAGGNIMLRSFALLCRALAALRTAGHPAVGRVRISMLGTMYGWREGDARPLEAVAANAGVGDLVREAPDRISYRRSLDILLCSHGALILGVDDDGYMPSKLFTYALSGKPLLASLRRDSAAFARYRESPGLGHALWFDGSGDMPLEEATEVARAFIEEADAGKRFDRRAILEPWLAPAMARRHSELFDLCVSDRPQTR